MNISITAHRSKRMCSTYRQLALLGQRRSICVFNQNRIHFIQTRYLVNRSSSACRGGRPPIQNIEELGDGQIYFTTNLQRRMTLQD